MTSHRQRLGRIILGTAAVAAVAAPSASAAPQRTPVVITNTVNEPVPVSVQGPVNVTGTVSLGQAVSLSGPVTIDDRTPLRVQVVEAGELMQLDDLMQMEAGVNNLTRTLLEVPEGKRFIVDTVNGFTLTEDDGRLRIDIGALGGFRYTVPLQRSSDVEPGIKRAFYNERIPFFVDGPNSLTVSIQRLAPNLAATVVNPIGVIGRLVDCPECGKQ